MTTYIAVDIEATGASYKKHKVLSVGFVVGDGTVVLERKRFNVLALWKPVEEGGDFEARCINEFWSKMDEKTKEECKRDAVEDFVAWKAIEGWLNEMEHKYEKIEFLTDNASFDIARIDYCLDKYCDRLPMRFSTTGKYRAIYSADDMYEMLSSEQRAICDKQIAEIVVHDHNPVNDAEYVYMQYVMVMKYRLK
jgi:DNA polymerase III epsilon subunit-like protein